MPVRSRRRSRTRDIDPVWPGGRSRRCGRCQSTAHERHDVRDTGRRTNAPSSKRTQARRTRSEVKPQRCNRGCRDTRRIRQGQNRSHHPRPLSASSAADRAEPEFDLQPAPIPNRAIVVRGRVVQPRVICLGPIVPLVGISDRCICSCEPLRASRRRRER